ncbi:hypothetical protein BS47DRAFT_416673 [Hydnum rufescens UP504]|uniref:Uncharacterized protein n=1 Tax=Hydnum rufescens UP504 TaxID=1448309 RepID=A0A9P6BB93_9AGAM|nr:hypothetical protein BS47DRAFT_416673 [Hydnum rufescens UP504]
MAASAIAGDELEFSKWLEGTGVIERRGEAPADQAFRDELAQAKLLPTWFPNIKTAEFDSHGLREDFLAELKKINPQETTNTPYNMTLKDSLPIIQLAWGTLKSLENQRTSYDPEEVDWRLAIDVLIQHVFGRTDFENNTAIFREPQLLQVVLVTSLMYE